MEDTNLTDTLIAAAIKDRSAFETIEASEETSGFVGDYEPIWKEVRDYYARDERAGSVDLALVEAAVAATTASPKVRDRRISLLGKLRLSSLPTVSAANVIEHINAAKRLRIGNELASALALRRDTESIMELISQYGAIGDSESGRNPDDSGAATDLAGLIRGRGSRTGGLFISPTGLNKALGGGLLPGHNVTIFARPECGKTAVAINAAVGFAKKGIKVLYVGNEDPCEDLQLRALCCITGRPLEELVKDPDQAQEEAKSLGIDNLIFRDISPGTLTEVERMVKRYEPKVLVVDQLRNLLSGSGKSDNFTQHLDRMAQGVRALGKKYGLVTISITQAGDSARDKPVLDDGDIDSSNTGIPGAADVLIGIGMTQTMQQAGVRNLCICKNKLTGDHAVISVNIQPALSRVRG